MDDLQEYLEVVEGDSTFTTRRFDLILHTHPSFCEFTPAEQIAYHKRKQEDILDLAEGIEQELFNDPTVKYPFRKHFNGAEGTMSNLLTSAYFTVYARLLEGNYGIQVNVLDDLKTIFALASSFPVENGKFAVDEDELDSLQRAIKQLWKRYRGQGDIPFTHAWFTSFEAFLRTIHEDALQSYPFYQANPNQRTFDQVLGWKLSRASSAQREEWCIRGYIPSYDHDLYEYYPPYCNPQWRTQLLEAYLQKLPVIAALFNPWSSKTVNRPSVPEAALSQKS